MSGDEARHPGVLRWYPAPWRERYGDELAALLDDTLDGRRPTLRLRLSLAWAGLRERARAAALVGSSTPSPERVRAGSLLVLCAWSLFVLAGITFAKASEHFQLVVPHRDVAVPQGAFRAVAGLAVVGAVVVAVGALVALPAFVRFLHEGGWPAVRRSVVRAGVVTVVFGAAFVALVVVANTLTPAQRNGGLVAHPVERGYLIQFLATAALFAATLALWTAAAVTTARRIELGKRALAAEAALAAALTGVMVLSTVATAIWWAATEAAAPVVLRGLPLTSTSTPPIHPQIAATMALMVLSCVAAGYGLVRIARSWRDVRPAA